MAPAVQPRGWFEEPSTNWAPAEMQSEEEGHDEGTEPWVIMSRPQNTGEPANLKGQEVSGFAQHPTRAGRQPGFANKRQHPQ
jgi:hypothetical protein